MLNASLVGSPYRCAQCGERYAAQSTKPAMRKEHRIAIARHLHHRMSGCFRLGEGWYQSESRHMGKANTSWAKTCDALKLVRKIRKKQMLTTLLPFRWQLCFALRELTEHIDRSFSLPQVEANEMQTEQLGEKSSTW